MFLARDFQDLDHFKARAARHGNEMERDMSGVLEVVDTGSQFLHLLSLGNMMGIIFFHLVLLNSVAVQDAQKQCFDFACSQNNRHRSHCGTCLGRHHVAGSMAPGACTGTSWLCCQGIGGASCEANPGDLEMFFHVFSIIFH